MTRHPHRAAGGAARLDGLNPQQQAVVEHGDGPALVIAGAGTGKTRVLVHRAAALIRRGVVPERILLLTFTRRAAQELRRRVVQLSGDSQLALPWCGTFHATAARLLRLYGRAIGVPPGFSILDETDSRSLMWAITTELFPPEARQALPAKGLLSRLYSYSRNTRCDLVTALAEVGGLRYQGAVSSLERIYAEYARRKRQSCALDYDDLLSRWLDLLHASEVACASRFDHIMVDEYQDTNVLQADILMALCRRHRNLMVVGDDAQAIYGFRGATVTNILDFPRLFPDAVSLRIEQNYRSTQGILDAANALIAEATVGFRKSLFTKLGTGLAPELWVTRDDREQAEAVAREVLLAWQSQQVPLRQQAVLFRSSYQSFKIELALQKLHIPYRKFGGPRFADAAHVKDVVAFLRCLENRHDEAAWHRLFGLLPGVGEATAAKAFAAVAASERPAAALAEFRFPKRAAARQAPFVGLVSTLFSGELSLLAQVDAVLEFYLPIVPELYDAPEGRVANLRELRSLSLNYPDRRAFLDELAVGDDSLVGETDEAKAEFLTLSTIHSAKGCEWDRVIVINLIEGGLPGGPSEDDPLQIEEERRLLYVAMTRARRKLVLTYPVSRETVDRGARCFAPCRPSRFLSAEVQACLSLNQDEDDPGALLYEYEPEYGRRSAGDRDRGGWRRRYR